MHETTIDGMTYEQVRYNVYAFTCDVKRYTRNRDAARTPHTKAGWTRKLAEAQQALATNQRRLAAFATLCQSPLPQPTDA